MIARRFSRAAAPTALAFALILPGCGSQTGPTQAAPTAAAAGIVSAAPAAPPSEAPPDVTEGQDEAGSPIRQRYSCEDGTGVVAEYVESHTGEQNVNLDFGDKEIGLPLAQSASGAKYEGPAALVPGKKTTWWTKGEEAMLIVADSEDSDGSTETVVNCQEVSS